MNDDDDIIFGKPRNWKRPTPRFNGTAAKAGRDEGMDRALESEEIWTATAQRMAADAFGPGWVGLFEEVRRELVRKGMWEPHVPQCWSALCNGLLRRGIYERVDDWDHPIGIASHSSTYRKIRRAG